MSGQILGGVQPPPMILAQPINDIQLVALVAAQQIDKAPADAVDWAMEVVAYAIAKGQELPYLARQIKNDLNSQVVS